MLKEAIEYIVHLKTPHFHKDEFGREFADRTLHPVTVGLIAPATVTTLAGLCDLAQMAFEALEPDAVVVQVVSHREVTLYAKQSDPWSRRTVFVKSELPEGLGFMFGQFMTHEAFIIGLQAMFVATEDRDYLLQLASNLTAQRVRVSEDDGVSQSVNLRAGVVLKADAATVVKTRVKLAPFRTFREVDQPASEFVFRLRNGGEDEPPSLALFEADGGKWKIDAMEIIGRFLRVRLDTDKIPVVI